MKDLGRQNVIIYNMTSTCLRICFLLFKRSMLKVQDDSLKATELAYKCIVLLAKFVIMTFLFIFTSEISKSQNDMADRCVLTTDYGKNVERRKQRRSQSDTAINITSRVSILLYTVSDCKNCFRSEVCL